MLKTRWSAMPLRTKGMLVALIPGIPMIVLWLLIGVALVRPTAPTATTVTRQAQELILRQQIALATERAAAYARTGGAADQSVPDLTLAQGYIPDTRGQAILQAAVESLSAARAAFREVQASPRPVSEELAQREQQAFTEASAAVEALAEQRASWLAGETAATRRRSSMFTFLFLGGSVLAVIGGAWLSVRLMRNMTTRIERVVDAADGLVQGRSIELDDFGQDEIGKLARRLEDILGILRARERDLTIKNEDLAAVNRELEAFSYSVSHDLRAPLRAIAGFSQIIEEDAGPQLDQGSRDALSRVRAATERMGVLIDQLLKLARLSKASLEPARVDVAAMSEAVVAQLRTEAPGRKVDVEIEPHLTVHADPELFRIVLTNLLDNAWKYTGRTASPRIRVAASTQGDAADGDAIEVSDNGAGFDMAHSRMLFGVFQRLHSQKEFAGIGVGLATVQRIVHRHHGQVMATAAPGQGATFTLVFPKERGPQP